MTLSPLISITTFGFARLANLRTAMFTPEQKRVSDWVLCHRSLNNSPHGTTQANRQIFLISGPGKMEGTIQQKFKNYITHLWLGSQVRSHRGIRGQCLPQIFCPPNFLSPEKFVLNMWLKQKPFPLKNVFCPPKLKTCLRACWGTNCKQEQAP